ncbi:putative membrane protein, partial [Chlamydia psittaci 03DC29]
RVYFFREFCFSAVFLFCSSRIGYRRNG